jgi:long-chain fatty acid transport protein
MNFEECPQAPASPFVKNTAIKHRLKPFAAAMLFAGFYTSAGASGFALIDQSTSSAGNAYAGAAAVAEDASTIYFNPAGLSLLQGSQTVVGVHGLAIDAKFSKTSATSAVGSPATGGEGGNIGGNAAIPNFYYATQINQDMSFGIGVNAPFGLKSNYEPTWVGRYQATLSELKSVNINPTMAWKVSDTVSIGAGLNLQYFEAELSKNIDFGSICFGALGAAAPAVCGPTGFLPQSRDGQARLTGNDWGYGWNVGAMFDLTKDTRLGVAYRSSIEHVVKGAVAYTIPAGLPGPIAASPSFTNTSVSTTIKTPEFLEVSVVSKIDSKLTLMGDVTWNGWSRLQELRVNFDNGAPSSVVPEHWKDSWRFSVGANYQFSEYFKLRTGIAYEQSGIDDALRTATLPDSDRTWLAVGGNYRLSNGNSIDFAYAHGLIKNSTINHSEPPVGGTIVGGYNSKVDIFSVQWVHRF